jgi:hypothetical protein
LSPSFDFIKNRFKSKPKLKPESSDQAEIEKATQEENTAVDRDYDLDRNDQNEPALERSEISDSQRIAQLSGKAISVEEATNRLRRIQEQKTAELVQELSPIRDSAQASLESIVDLASDLQNDEIKVENERFESAVENARSMVITSIMKDANTSFPELESYEDAMKFKDRLESLTNRFGQLTGSHSKLFNVFLKKYADKFRSELADFSNLNKKTSKLIENYNLDLDDTNACSQKISNLSNNLSSLKYSQERIATMAAEVAEMEKNITQLNIRRREIEHSEAYKNHALLESQSKELEKSKAEFREYVADLFSHLNRAFTKYSYGVSKNVAAKIEVLSSSPWEIFLNERETEMGSSSESPNQILERSKEDRERIETYRSLLVEIQGTVIKGTISLKDSDKVLAYLDRAIDLFPKIESRGWEIRQKEIVIRQKQNRKAFDSLISLDDLIQRNENDIAEKKILIEEIQAAIEVKKTEIQELKNECSNLLTEIIGQDKVITTVND